MDTILTVVTIIGGVGVALLIVGFILLGRSK